MHNLQDPEDAAVTSDPFGYNKVNEGEQHEKRISVEMVVSLSMAMVYHAHVVRFCF